jgi:UPF0755 protein
MMREGHGTRSRVKPPRAAIALAGAIAAAALLSFAAAFAAFALAARPSTAIPEGGAIFAVERGEAAGAVARRLESAGLIRSSLAFRALAKIRGVDSSIKAGSYRVMPGMGAAGLLDDLVAGRQALVRVTVPEGLTLSQIAVLLDGLGIAGKAEFVFACRDPAFTSELGLRASSLEGYLFPDTYLLPVAFGPREAARAMVDAFKSRVSSIPEAAALSPSELHSRVVLASIVEREYRLPEEAPLMASVFYNRLRIGMALQSCATVVYVITEKLGKPHPEQLFDRDIRIPDSYNTYLHPGLPPGPISNPGLTALLAAFRPAATKYLYFRLVDEERGSHHFSASLEEHVGARSLLVKKVGD